MVGALVATRMGMFCLEWIRRTSDVGEVRARVRKVWVWACKQCQHFGSEEGLCRPRGRCVAARPPPCQHRGEAGKGMLAWVGMGDTPSNTRVAPRPALVPFLSKYVLGIHPGSSPTQTIPSPHPTQGQIP